VLEAADERVALARERLGRSSSGGNASFATFEDLEQVTAGLLDLCARGGLIQTQHPEKAREREQRGLGRHRNKLAGRGSYADRGKRPGSVR